MGNPQERLIWLAGFIDGEGYLGIKKAAKKKVGGSIYQLTPRVVIVNTNNVALDNVLHILNENGVKYSVHFPKRYSETHSPVWHVEISSMEPVLNLLNLVRPHMIVKTKQADCLISYCRRRLLLLNTRYNESDLVTWQEIKELNQNPQRLHAEVLEQAQDIVRSCMKVQEASRND